MADIESIESSNNSSVKNGGAGVNGRKLAAAKSIAGQSNPQEDAFLSAKGGAGELIAEEAFDDKFDAKKTAEADIHRQKSERAKEILSRRFLSPINDTRTRVQEGTSGLVSTVTATAAKTATGIASAVGGAVNNAVINPMNQAMMAVQAALAEFMSKFINISDKIAAFVGDREKDIREKLSSNFLKVEEKVYDLMEKIDASFEQKDHHKEKKTRDDKEKYDPDNSARIDNKVA